MSSSPGTLADALQTKTESDLDRRAFLRRSGLVAGSIASLGALPLTSIRQAEAGPPPPLGAQVTVRKSICTFCSVGCTVAAEVANGVWIGQEPAWDSPLNRGSHCAKGAAAREVVLGDRRLKYPMKLINGYWVRVSWQTAIDEIGDKLAAIREKSGPELGLLAWLRQVLQRRSLSLPQTRGVLGHQQRRPFSAHLPFHHRRRSGQYLGLRCDDQQLQRHPQLQDDADHGRQPGGSASGVTTTLARRQGAQACECHRDSIRALRVRPRTRPTLCGCGPARTLR